MQKGITGRDDLIQAEALVYAIALIQSRVVSSNCLDMCQIVRARMDPQMASMIAAEVVCLYKLRLDIDPENEDPEYKAQFETALDEHLAHYKGKAA